MGGSDVETQWSTYTNGAQTSPAAGADSGGRASVEAVLRWKRSDRVVPGLRWECNDRVVSRLHEIHEVVGRRQSAKQVLDGFTNVEFEAEGASQTRHDCRQVLVTGPVTNSTACAERA